MKGKVIKSSAPAFASGGKVTTIAEADYAPPRPNTAMRSERTEYAKARYGTDRTGATWDKLTREQKESFGQTEGRDYKDAYNKELRTRDETGYTGYEK